VSGEAERRRKARRGAVLLGLAALAIYVGFYLMQLATRQAEMQDHDTPIATRNRRLTGRLALLAAAMFGFGFLLAPLYSLFCEIVGIGIRCRIRRAGASQQVDTSRFVTIESVPA
jgi:uncharacterized membrane protein YedE/YeeE